MRRLPARRVERRPRAKRPSKSSRPERNRRIPESLEAFPVHFGGVRFAESRFQLGRPARKAEEIAGESEGGPSSLPARGLARSNVEVWTPSRGHDGRSTHFGQGHILDPHTGTYLPSYKPPRRRGVHARSRTRARVRALHRLAHIDRARVARVVASLCIVRAARAYTCASENRS
jgi:hypothetical protein